jgi:hypothetical protein
MAQGFGAAPPRTRPLLQGVVPNDIGADLREAHPHAADGARPVAKGVTRCRQPALRFEPRRALHRK